MDGKRFDTLTQSIVAPSRRTVLAGLAGGLLSTLPLALAREEAGAKKKNRRKKKKIWYLHANPLTHHDECPPSSGDQNAFNSHARFEITRRKKRYTICGHFQFHSDGVSTQNINVRDVVIQTPNTCSSANITFSFSGWVGANRNDECKPISRQIAKQIIGGGSYVNIRTNNPSHTNGAVAGHIVRTHVK